MYSEKKGVKKISLHFWMIHTMFKNINLLMAVNSGMRREPRPSSISHPEKVVGAGSQVTRARAGQAAPGEVRVG